MNKQTQPTIAITGASGFLGSELVKHFDAKGWQVRALVRGAKRYKGTTNVQYVEFDMTAVDAAVLRGADYLVHAARIKYDQRHPETFEQNITAARQLILASRKHGLKHNVFISSMSSHGDAVSMYGKQKLASEQLFDTDRDVSLRPGLIIGDGGIVREMAAFMKSKHAVPLVGGGKQPLQIIDVHELVQAVDAAITKQLSGVLTIATSEVYSYKQFYQQLAASLGIRVVFVPIPFGLLLGAMRAINALNLPLSVGEDNLWGLKMLRAVDNAADMRKLGVRPSSLEQVLASMHGSR